MLCNLSFLHFCYVHHNTIIPMLASALTYKNLHKRSNFVPNQYKKYRRPIPVGFKGISDGLVNSILVILIYARSSLDGCYEKLKLPGNSIFPGNFLLLCLDYFFSSENCNRLLIIFVPTIPPCFRPASIEGW